MKGHSVGITSSPASGRLSLPGSIQAQLTTGEDLTEGIREENRRYQKIAGRGRRNLLFLIDTSGSMLSDDRFATVKGCVISGGGGASLDLPFTSSAELAAKRIESLKGGGSTPLVQALGIAGNLLDRMREEDLSIFLLSDGRYNRSQTGREVRQVREFGDFCRSREIPITFIDASPGNRTARERSLLFARQLHAAYRRLDDLRADWFLPEEEAEA